MKVNVFDITKSVVLVVVALFIGYMIWNVVNSFQKTSVMMQHEIIKLTDNMVEIKNQTGDKVDFDKFRKELEENNNKLLQQVEAQKAKTGEVLDELGKVKTEVKQTRELNTASTKTYKIGDDINHYHYKEITVKNQDGTVAKVAWVMFYPNRPEGQQWKTGTFPITVDTTVVETENKNGTFNRYAQVEITDKDDNQIPTTINEIKWEKIPLKEKTFSWLNPRLGFGLYGSTTVAFGLDISVASYGKTKRDMDYRFLTFGINYDNEKFALTLEPVSWNIGTVIPLIENVFVGPFVSYDFDSDPWSIGAKVSIPF